MTNACYFGTDASGPPATNSSRPSLIFLIVTRDPLVSTTLPPYVVKVTFSPGRRSFGPQPWRRTVFGLVISMFQVVTFPPASVTSTYTRIWGFCHSTFWTTPVNVNFLLASYSVSNP